MKYKPISSFRLILTICIVGMKFWLMKMNCGAHVWLQPYLYLAINYWFGPKSKFNCSLSLYRAVQVFTYENLYRATQVLPYEYIHFHRSIKSVLMSMIKILELCICYWLKVNLVFLNTQVVTIKQLQHCTYFTEKVVYLVKPGIDVCTPMQFP